MKRVDERLRLCILCGYISLALQRDVLKQLPLLFIEPGVLAYQLSQIGAVLALLLRSVRPFRERSYAMKELPINNVIRNAGWSGTA